ncbi:MAG: YcjX family protein, partial [Cobetia crustatorum]
LQFFPLTGLTDWTPEALVALPEASLYRTLARRFDHYRRHVVQPFYHDHFRRFDRQIVLIDVLGALNAGPAPFRDLSRALDKLFDSFAYGRRHLLARLMDRRIDRLAIAATKADHVTPEQHGAMRDLLEQLLADPLKRLRYRDVPLKAFTIAAIRSSEAREVVENGERHPALAGQLLAMDEADPAVSPRESVLLFPGEVPSRLPEATFWNEGNFQFPNFAPPRIEGNAPPHIRMDAVLDWLLGDHLK